MTTARGRESDEDGYRNTQGAMNLSFEGERRRDWRLPSDGDLQDWLPPITSVVAPDLASPKACGASKENEQPITRIDRNETRKVAGRESDPQLPHWHSRRQPLARALLEEEDDADAASTVANHDYDQEFRFSSVQQLRDREMPGEDARKQGRAAHEEIARRTTDEDVNPVTPERTQPGAHSGHSTTSPIGDKPMSPEQVDAATRTGSRVASEKTSPSIWVHDQRALLSKVSNGW